MNLNSVFQRHLADQSSTIVESERNSPSYTRKWFHEFKIMNIKQRTYQPINQNILIFDRKKWLLRWYALLVLWSWSILCLLLDHRPTQFGYFTEKFIFSSLFSLQAIEKALFIDTLNINKAWSVDLKRIIRKIDFRKISKAWLWPIWISDSRVKQRLFRFWDKSLYVFFLDMFPEKTS